MYLGNTVNFRTKKLSYKDKNSVHNSPEDWIIFENTQEAIAFDPYTHGYYRVTERVGEAFRDGLKLKK